MFLVLIDSYNSEFIFFKKCHGLLLEAEDRDELGYEIITSGSHEDYGIDVNWAWEKKYFTKLIARN